MSRLASKSWFVVLSFVFGVAVVFAQAQRQSPPPLIANPAKAKGRSSGWSFAARR